MTQSNAMEQQNRVHLKKQESYQDKTLGFDRTQLYKEYMEPQIRRQSALKSAVSIMEAHELKLSINDLMLLTKRIDQFIETGNSSWSSQFDSYVKLKSDEKLKFMEIK
jgi:hypothetical protein